MEILTVIIAILYLVAGFLTWLLICALNEWVNYETLPATLVTWWILIPILPGAVFNHIRDKKGL